jgi:hypothetical protein
MPGQPMTGPAANVDFLFWGIIVLFVLAIVALCAEHIFEPNRWK